MPYKDRQKQLSYMRGHQAQVRLAMRELRSMPCTDCKHSFPWYVMDFDHARGQKKFTLNRASSIEAAIEELKKCDLVCANCHKVRTHNRRVAKLENATVLNTVQTH